MDHDIEVERASGHMSSHMSAHSSGRIAVVAGRRRWTVEQKLSMLRDAFGADGSVRAACERHGIGSGQIYTWRRQAMSGELTGLKPAALPAFTEVEVTPAFGAAPPAAPLASTSTMPASCSVPAVSGQIGISLPSGVRLTVDAGVDADALARVLAVLGR
ncbi:MAG: IS66-like element accessory protein TnpA [Sandaracinobacter sp.]